MPEPIVLALIPVVCGGVVAVVVAWINNKGERLKAEVSKSSAAVDTANTALNMSVVVAGQLRTELDRKDLLLDEKDTRIGVLETELTDLRALNNQVSELQKDLAEERAVAAALAKQNEQLTKGQQT